MKHIYMMDSESTGTDKSRENISQHTSTPGTLTSQWHSQRPRLHLMSDSCTIFTFVRYPWAQRGCRYGPMLIGTFINTILYGVSRKILCYDLANVTSFLQGFDRPGSTFEPFSQRNNSSNRTQMYHYYQTYRQSVFLAFLCASNKLRFPKSSGGILNGSDIS